MTNKNTSLEGIEFTKHSSLLDGGSKIYRNGRITIFLDRQYGSQTHGELFLGWDNKGTLIPKNLWTFKDDENIIVLT